MSGVVLFANCIIPKSFVMFTIWSNFISSIVFRDFFIRVSAFCFCSGLFDLSMV